MFINKIKGRLAVLASAIIVCMPLQSSFALENNNLLDGDINRTEISNEESINDELKKLEEQYGGEFFINDEFSKEFDDSDIKLEFKSIKEFEDTLKEFQRKSETMKNQNLIIEDSAIAPYAIGFKTLKYNAGDWGHLYWRSLDFNYETKVVNGKKQLVRVYNRRSYPQGLTIAFWKEKWHHTPVYNSSRTSVSMKVDGEWRLAVSVGGQPVGYVNPSTWNFKYSI